MKNPNIKIKKTEILSKNWAILTKVTLDYTKEDGSVQEQKREVYNRGNGAVILLFNKVKKNNSFNQTIPIANLLKQQRNGLFN